MGKDSAGGYYEYVDIRNLFLKEKMTASASACKYLTERGIAALNIKTWRSTSSSSLLYVWFFPSHSNDVSHVVSGVSSHSRVVSPLRLAVIFLEGFPKKIKKRLKTRILLIRRAGQKPVFVSNRHTDGEQAEMFAKPTNFNLPPLRLLQCRRPEHKAR